MTWVIGPPLQRAAGGFVADAAFGNFLMDIWAKTRQCKVAPSGWHRLLARHLDRKMQKAARAASPTRKGSCGTLCAHPKTTKAGRTVVGSLEKSGERLRHVRQEEKDLCEITYDEEEKDLLYQRRKYMVVTAEKQETEEGSWSPSGGPLFRVPITLCRTTRPSVAPESISEFTARVNIFITKQPTQIWSLSR